MDMRTAAPARAEELTYTAVRKMERAKSICFLPMSALEVHGPHLPVGMDMFMARWMAEETGRRFAARGAACGRVSRRPGLAMFSPSIAVLHAIVSGKRFDRVEELLGRSLSPEERRGLLAGEHAGTWETSFMLAENPKLVGGIYRQPGPDGPPPLRPAP